MSPISAPSYVVIPLLILFFGTLGAAIVSFVYHMAEDTAGAQELKASAVLNARRWLIGFWVIMAVLMLPRLPDYSLQRLLRLVAFWIGVPCVVGFLRKGKKEDACEVASAPDNTIEEGDIVARYRPVLQHKIALFVSSSIGVAIVFFAFIPLLLSRSLDSSSAFLAIVLMVPMWIAVSYESDRHSVKLSTTAISGYAGSGSALTIPYSEVDSERTFSETQVGRRALAPLRNSKFIWDKKGRRIVLFPLFLGDEQVNEIIREVRERLS